MLMLLITLPVLVAIYLEIRLKVRCSRTDPIGAN
jgi:hypothetical protein